MMKTKKKKAVITGIPVRRKRGSSARRRLLPPAHVMLGVGAPMRYHNDVGFIRRLYPRIAYYVSEVYVSRLSTYTYSVICSEWLQHTGEMVVREDLTLHDLPSRDACYTYIDTIKQRLQENPLYVNA